MHMCVLIVFKNYQNNNSYESGNELYRMQQLLYNYNNNKGTHLFAITFTLNNQSILPDF